MGPFVGRKEELSRLEQVWETSGQKAVVVYGRRRIGKTELLKRFCEGRRSIFIDCVRGSLEDNLNIMAGVLNSLDGGSRTGYGFITAALNDIIAYCKQQKTVVVFDELPYLLSTGDQVASCLQHFIDDLDRETDSMVIMCGSSMSVMKRETTDYDRPLYGRFSHRMEVRQLPYADCAELHPGMSDLDRLKLYLTVGGVPKYHLDPTATTYRDYVVRHFLSPMADMPEEAESIITAEFTPRDRYMAIVNAISDGQTSLKNICDRVGLDRATCLKCLEGLTEVGIVDTVHPMMGSPKRPIYRIRDNMVAFCQEIVMVAKSYPLRDPDGKFDAIDQRISSFLGHRFEDFCSDYVIRHWDCLEIGKWWGPDESKQIKELDIVATVLEGDVKVSLFGDCKFIKGEYAYSTLRQFRRNIELTKDDRTQRIVLFSVSGFESDVSDEATMGYVTLVGLEDLTRP